MKVLEAAERVISEAGRPLSIRDITAAMLDKGYWQTQGLTPEATVGAQLAMDRKNRGDASLFVRPIPGHYGLKGQVPEVAAPEAAPGVQQALFEEQEEEEQDPTATAQTLSFTEAAVIVLQDQVPPRPMHYREITRIALERRLLTTQGKTPEATMYAQILTEIDRYTKRHLPPRFKKLGQGMVCLATDESGQVPVSLWSDQDESLLQRIKVGSSAQFENLVAKLLTQLFAADIQVTPPSGDRGLDARGHISLNNVVEVELVAQAKRFTTKNVQRPDIQNLRGSMGPQSIGIFITTKGFSAGAVAEAQRPTAVQPIGLINGHALVGLMKECDLTINANGDPVLMDDLPGAAQIPSDGTEEQ